MSMSYETTGVLPQVPELTPEDYAFIDACAITYEVIA